MSSRPLPPDETSRSNQNDAPKGYEVGHGRPPVATRFKPGQSGNPKGRPKASKNLSTLAREKLQAKVSVRENGRERRMSKAEIGVTKMVNRFVETGDPKLYILLKQLEGDSGGSKAIGIPATTSDEQQSHADILAWYLEQNRANDRGEA
ncbi:DUF5681 domain-containing protein [Bosea sp. (in: a-proteobacteria)]|jgi:hypothetical protein|uniref:DUF5681 domain-containing protein n=1 Tax=Bosea sp. (in: a-proteobacteria) TaxID=1871050 RepID=UPI00086EA011|nr:DUF5681 domain-containing protein [Bosea sp. (in: a-proteobacteria)]MBN9437466.1 hypothetical protein [Bosea sp. (in: a-proteobacteria)]ODT15635.1 MAG: hypothetical protein ABS35_30885 [Kaistia sp. SCN 65-12]